MGSFQSTNSFFFNIEQHFNRINSFFKKRYKNEIRNREHRRILLSNRNFPKENLGSWRYLNLTKKNTDRRATQSTQPTKLRKKKKKKQFKKKQSRPFQEEEQERR